MHNYSLVSEVNCISKPCISLFVLCLLNINHPSWTVGPIWISICWHTYTPCQCNVCCVAITNVISSHNISLIRVTAACVDICQCTHDAATDCTLGELSYINWCSAVSNLILYNIVHICNAWASTVVAVITVCTAVHKYICLTFVDCV